MQTKTITLPQYKHIFFVLTAISLLSLVFYVYAVNETVRNVVMRQKMQAELSTLMTKMGEMEFSYIASQNSIDLNKAYAMGFSEVTTSQYVRKDGSVAVANAVTIPR